MRGSADPSPTADRPKIVSALDGDDIRRAFQAATRCLERQRDAINALNVFPVPDGDTGTNMLLTMRSVNEQGNQAPDSSAGAAMAAMAHGALLGARGNSGVILSQFFHGLALGSQEKDSLNGEGLARAFGLASTSASSAVSKPVEGTMLTVIRELSLAASQQIERAGCSKDVLSVWRAALEAANLALSRTPLQLAVLREAGVVDAGGQGVVTLLEGAWHYLAGEDVDELELGVCTPVDSSAPGDLPSVKEEYLAATEDELYGYCTQFLIQGEGLDVDSLREQLSTIAESTVVVGSESLVKVHVHTHDPGPVVSYAVSVGSISQVRMDNIDQQHREFVSLHRGQSPISSRPSDAVPRVQAAPEGQTMAVVAVVSGEGFVRLFRELGCASVVAGGQSMNPSTEELLNAARATEAKDVMLLPNNPNIIPTARQAVYAAEGTPVGSPVVAGEAPRQTALHVVPSRSIPQGVAALLAFNPEGTLESNLESAEKALATVKTIEVTKAVRPAIVGGLAIEEGQYIGLLEGDLVAAGDSAGSVLLQTLINGGATGGELVTMYWGKDIEDSQAREEAAQLQEIIPGVEVEVVYGGQPYYHYVASLE